MASEAKPNRLEDVPDTAEPQPVSTQQDTFFLSRGRLLMEAPLVELAGLAEQASVASVAVEKARA